MMQEIMNKPLRIIVSSNSPAASTGYGVQCKGLAYGLKELGHAVAIHAWYGLQGGVINAGGIMMYPRIRHSFGGDTGIVARHFNADLVISIQDVWILPDEFADTLPCPWAAWVTIDGYPLPHPIGNRMKTARYPVAYSKFGYQQMVDYGIENPAYIPLGLSDDYYPEFDKRDALRQQLGAKEDTFIVLMVAANKGYPSRKSYPEAILAFSKFHEKYPNSLLYLHTDIRAGDGLELMDICTLCGLDDTAVKWTDQDSYALGMDGQFMRQLYQASDVLLNPAKSEGFGLPIVEAQACGTPVITTRHSAMEEVTRLGHCLEPLQQEYNPLGQWFSVPSVDRIVDALEDVHKNPPSEQERQAASYDVIAEYNWPNVVRQWQETIIDQQTAVMQPIENKEVAYAD
jgi:glycosyltransferase involved in cell wall biosynthesis